MARWDCFISRFELYANCLHQNPSPVTGVQVMFLLNLYKSFTVLHNGIFLSRSPLSYRLNPPFRGRRQLRLVLVRPTRYARSAEQGCLVRVGYSDQHHVGAGTFRKHIASPDSSDSFISSFSALSSQMLLLAYHQAMLAKPAVGYFSTASMQWPSNFLNPFTIWALNTT